MICCSAPCVIEPAVARHVGMMADDLRAADAAEAVAMGCTPREALWRSFRSARYAKVALVRGRVAAMWGLGGPAFASTGHLWIATTPAIEEIRVTFVRECRKEIAIMLAICPELRGVVDDQYRKAKRLLDALGFSLSEPFPYGPNKMPFRHYLMRRETDGV